MISPIQPSGPSSPAEKSPDLVSVSKPFVAELNGIMAAFSHLTLANVDPQLQNMAERVIALGEKAQQALRAAAG